MRSLSYFVCFFFLATSTTLAKPDQKNEIERTKQLPRPGTQDESELIVKYTVDCAGSYRVVEGAKSNSRETHSHPSRSFNRLVEFVVEEYDSNNMASSGTQVDVTLEENNYSFYHRRVATFTERSANTLSVMPQAIGLQDSTVREPQANLGNITMTCDLQRFINLDICKLSNYEGKINPRRIENFLSRDECVEFAEFSVQMKSPMDDEAEKIAENIGQRFTKDTYHSNPNDRHFETQQWFLQDSHSYSVNAQTAWGQFQDNSNGDIARGVVGVVDTGVWMSYPNRVHSDLKDKMWSNEADCDFDGEDSDGNGYVDDCNGWNFGADNNDLSDYHGHGTSVSGTVGASTHNSVGVASVGWPVKIMTLKTYFRSSEFAKIVNYMAGFGVKIMNGSFAYPSASSSLKELTRVGQQNGILMVFAASNENCDNDAIVNSPTGQKNGCDLYPGSLPDDNILSVCSSNERGNKSYFSSYGKVTVDVCAPGSGIFTTRFSSSSPNQYGRASGTSYASPIVAGIAGLVALQHPDFTYLDISNAIKNSCNVVSSLQNYSVCGGIVDAGKALAWTT